MVRLRTTKRSAAVTIICVMETLFRQPTVNEEQAKDSVDNMCADADSFLRAITANVSRTIKWAPRINLRLGQQLSGRKAAPDICTIN